MAAIARGIGAEFLVGVESTFGTVPADAVQLRVNESTVKASQPLNRARTILGRNPSVPWPGFLDVSGQVVLPVDSIGLPHMLNLIFGAAADAGSDPYTHTYDVALTQPSFTIEHGFTDLATPKYFQYSGCKAAGFSLGFGGDDELEMAINIMGADETIAGSSMDATPTDGTGIVRLDKVDGAITEGGVSLATVLDCTINIGFGLDGTQYPIGNSGKRSHIPEGGLKVNGELTMQFQTTTELDKAIAGTESALLVVVTGSASSIFSIEIPELKFSRNGPEISGPGGLQIVLGFEGYYDDDGDASAVIVVATNDVASY